jgi:uncharacterized protein YcaQ
VRYETRVPAGVKRLRAHAIGHSLFAPTGLEEAIERLGFVQADPIRAPARAQDLILGQRVRGYRAGDLEREFGRLAVEEDYLYAYGFLARRAWRLLHPRPAPRLSALEAKVLAAVRERGVIHPKELEARFGRRRVTNAWGGLSKATTHALDHLHQRGYLRVAGRESGIRVYQAVAQRDEALPSGERLAGLVLVVADVLAPVAERTLSAIAARLARWIPGKPDHRAVLRALLARGDLESAAVDGVVYLWPPSSSAAARVEPPRRVRFLAPFDPVVWDRRRFEHLFGWSYRFEAYTPAARRVRGYYAMPMLWRDRVVGWANASAAGGELGVELGFADRRPRERDFGRAVDAEIARLERLVIG